MNTVESKYPVAIFELIPASKNGAGFVREDTVSSANPVTLIHPKNRIIQNESVVRQKNAKGDAFVNVPTRYIYNQEVTLKKEQEATGITPNPKTDKIVFVNGMITVPKDGAFVGLYNFLKDHAQNLSNPHREHFAHLQPIFREIKPAEDAHNDNANDFLIVEAVGYIRDLVTEKAGKFVYNEERIDALCGLFNVQGESPQQKTTALIAFAKANPQGFLTQAKANEQTIAIEVQHALKLKLIAFEGISAVYVGKGVKIKTFSNAQNTDDKKASALEKFFSSVSGKEAYDLFKVELAAAKAAHVSNN